ncbi:MAG: hypothetical protein HYR85_01055 [Planctomycetes bacterium]|nr:hypothetical protein [Planctomycetota bacterium]MBI3844790.1 hypothetical protein [Planctomycetota bacterium]
MNRSFHDVALVFALGTPIAPIAWAEEPVTYQEHIQPLFRNECVFCHDADKMTAGLDLSTYQAVMAGNGGGPVISPGSPDESRLYRVVMHLEEPFMPKSRKERLPDKDLDLIRRWIQGGALERAGAKPAAPSRPKVDLALAPTTPGKPSGAAAMPKDLLIEPVVHSRRARALLSLAVDPQAPIVALGGEHQVLLYHTESLDLLGILAFPEGEPYALEFSRSGSLLAVGGGRSAKSGHVVLFDVASGARVAEIGDEHDAVLAASLSPDQCQVAVGGPSRTLEVFSTADGERVRAIKKHTDWITAVAYSPDGVLLASGDRAGGLVVWEAKSGLEFYVLTGHKGAVTSLSFREDSNVLASSSEDGTVKLWDLQSGKEAKSWPAHPGGVLSVSFGRDGKLVTCGRDRLVRTWKGDGTKLLDFEPLGDIVLHAAFDGAAGRVIAGDWSGAVRVFGAVDGKRAGELDVNPPTIAERMDRVRNELALLEPTREKAAADLARAEEESKTSGATADSAPPTTEKAASDAKLQLDQATSRIEALRLEMMKLEAARRNVEVQAARDELSACEAEAQKLARVVDAAKEAARKAAADLAALEAAVASAPARIEQKQALVAKATEDLAAARRVEEAANAAVSEKEALVVQGTDLAQKLAEIAAKAPDEKSLAEAAARAKSTLDALATGVTAAKQLVVQREAEVRSAGERVAAAQAEEANERNDLEAAPAKIEVLERAVATAEAEVSAREAACVAASNAIAAARARLDAKLGSYADPKR